MWLQFESFLVLCSPVSFVNHIIRAKGNGKVVTYKIYDELHAESPWQLILLSYELAGIAEDTTSPLKITLMSATMDTPIFQTVSKAVRSVFPTYDCNHI